MSVTASLNAKQILIDLLRSSTKLYEKDLMALPEDKFTVSVMGCARTPQDFTAEVIGFNHFMAKIIRGEGGGWPSKEEREAFTATVDGPGKAINMLWASVEDLADTVSDQSDEQLAEQVDSPFGSPMSRFDLAMIAATHINYHDGQLNYIQACYGDGEVHWG